MWWILHFGLRHRHPWIRVESMLTDAIVLPRSEFSAAEALRVECARRGQFGPTYVIVDAFGSWEWAGQHYREVPWFPFIPTTAERAVLRRWCEESLVMLTTPTGSR